MTVLNYSNYNENDFNPNAYALIPAGRHRVRIEDVKERTSQSGKDMIELTLAVSGYNSKLWGYVFLDTSSPEAIKKTNQALGTIFNSFNIQHGDLELEHWKGRVGGVMVTHKQGINGEPRANVSYFLFRKEVDKLPAWKNSDSSSATTQDNIDADMMDFNDQQNNSHGIPF